VLDAATTRWDLAHDAPRFFTVVARHAPLQRHRFVLLTAEVQGLPDELCEVLTSLADRVLPIAFDLQTVLDTVAAISAAALVGSSRRTSNPR
jgi:hypothetical protein